jgi:glycosyltransferase involved in cell wall biosynthesis
MQFALTYANNTYDFGQKVMGRQSAGLGFIKAALAARPDRIWCYAESRDLAERFGQQVKSLSAALPEIRFVPWTVPAGLAAAGTLYRPDPGIWEDAWHRSHHASPRAYSLCGITHTLASQGALSSISRLLSAPLYPWDAVICTSSVAKTLIRKVFDTEANYIKSRFGATRIVEPQLPVIPLGVHCSEFEFSDGVRERSRASLNIAADDVVVLFAGRLTFHAKAHPISMFISLERAAARTSRKLHLVLFGQFPNNSIADAFRMEARLYAPTVNLIVLDGAIDENWTVAWSAADIFTSFSDNIQETFGLTPVEAMACGLPVVVSDWNGYKDTVRDGVDGFRIATWAPPEGSGNDIMDRYENSIDTYDIYIGSVSQFVAIDLDAAADAFVQLADSIELRQRMGDAGRRRAREIFDWSVVFARYSRLWDDLAEMRRSAAPVPGEADTFRRADRIEPFTLFRSFPTTVPNRRTKVRRIAEISVQGIAERRGLMSVNYATSVIPSEAVFERLIPHLREEPVEVGALLEACSDIPPVAIVRGLLWLAKMGMIALLPN